MSNTRLAETVLKDMLMTALEALGVGLVAALLMVCLILAVAPSAQAETSDRMIRQSPLSIDEVQRGSLLLKLASGGVSIDAPMLKTDVQMDISGMLARVSVHQEFRNPGRAWVEGIYVFPLPEDAAVDRMQLRIGERIIRGEIQEKIKAQKIYQQAKREGRKASLLSQERPNIFTMAVANIGPGESVTVEIEYQQSLHYDQGEFSVRFPLVVAPRYIPGHPVGDESVAGFNGSGWAKNTDQIADASRVTPPVVDPDMGEINPVTIQVNLDAGLPLARLESAYHAIESLRDETGIHRIRLKQGEVPANRDFELHWVPLTGMAPQAALFTEQWEQQTYALLMVMPPVKNSSADKRLPREAVFVIDTSGSMNGDSMKQAKAALKLALGRLTTNDRFNIIQFNNQTHSLFGRSVSASPENLQRALRYVDGMEAEGGTEMLPALKQALHGDSSESFFRQVIFLTDGSVGNEEALFSVIQQRLGSSRLFTIGIGSAPNSHFMTRAAEFGRGSFTYIGNVTEVKQKMSELFAKLEAPVLTDIAVAWSGVAEAEMWPKRIPDLYQGEPVVLAVRLEKMVDAIEISGSKSGLPWKQRVELGGGAVVSGVHQLWARRNIADLMGQRSRGRSEDEVRQAVLDVALEHQLVSRYTSLVAVDHTPSRPDTDTLESKSVPTNLPHGWNAGKVFGQLPQTATPGPLKLLIGFLLLTLGLGAAWYQRRLANGEIQA